MPQDDDEYQKGSLRQKIIQMLSCCCKSRFAQLFERGIDSLMDQSGLADEILFLSPDPLSPAAMFKKESGGANKRQILFHSRSIPVASLALAGIFNPIIQIVCPVGMVFSRNPLHVMLMCDAYHRSSVELFIALGVSYFVFVVAMSWIWLRPQRAALLFTVRCIDSNRV